MKLSYLVKGLPGHPLHPPLTDATIGIAHVVVGKADGTAWGGHLLEGYVWPTLEVVLVESPAELKRRLDEETGLPLIRIEHGDE